MADENTPAPAPAPAEGGEQKPEEQKEGAKPAEGAAPQEEQK